MVIDSVTPLLLLVSRQAAVCIFNCRRQWVWLLLTGSTWARCTQRCLSTPHSTLDKKKTEMQREYLTVFFDVFSFHTSYR